MKTWILMVGVCLVSSTMRAVSAQSPHLGRPNYLGPLVKRNAVKPIYTPAQRARILETSRLAYAASDAMKLGDYVLAEADARQSVALGPDSGLAEEALAASLDAQGKTQEALQVYQQIAISGGSFPRNLLPYARLLLKTGDYKKAAWAYNKALPRIADGAVIEKQGEFSPNVPYPTELAAAVQTALGLETDWRGYHGTYKEVIQQAQAHFQKALVLEPNSSLTNYYVGYGLKRLGRQAEAQAAFRRAAALGQGDIKEAAEKELPETERPK